MKGNTSLFDTRRYLSDFDSARTGHVLTDTLVIGSGVAGCRSSLEAARHGMVTLVTKGAFADGCTHAAQGGIAAALNTGDSPEQHYRDTMAVGCGLSDSQAVRRLVEDGPARIEELLEWGIELDRDGDNLRFAREAGHSINRIVHAHGDRTGRELVRTLEQRVRATDSIRVFQQCFVIDLVTRDGACLGAITYHPRHGHQIIWAQQTILASGGCGQLWRETTNPSVVTGDGMAAAFRAGALLRNVELMQFHPTTLYVAGAGRALISEAVRGEGAYLVDRDGERFMQAHHPDGELAPRDVVSRSTHMHLRKTRSNCVYLDVRHIKGFAARFPGITQLCRDFQIDVVHDLIPVRPSAHYMIGGVEAALDGSTSIDGLLCCGEVASTGVHGANRMASNSLLEGLVFGRLAGQTAGRRASTMRKTATVGHISIRNTASDRTALDLADIRNSLRSIMWRNVGIVRTRDRLHETGSILDFWAHYSLDKTFDDLLGWETQNILTMARLVAMAALERTESVGVHFRSDEQDTGPASPYDVTLARDPAGTTPRRAPRHST